MSTLTCRASTVDVRVLRRVARLAVVGSAIVDVVGEDDGEAAAAAGGKEGAVVE
jgi:hypothetical protein